MFVREVSSALSHQDGVAVRDGEAVVVLLNDQLDADDRAHVRDCLINAVATVAPAAGAVASRGFACSIPRPREAVG